MKKWLLSAILCSLAVFTFVSCIGNLKNKTERTIASDSIQDNAARSLYLSEKAMLNSDDFYLSKIQPIFNNRCISCHSCFNSPCQLNLTSFNGVDRGAIKDDIYDFTNNSKKSLTRLGIDVPSSADWNLETKEWRKTKYVGKHGKNGFFPVVVRSSANNKANVVNSVLAQMLNIKASFEGDSYHYTFVSEKSRMCPRNPANDSGKIINKEIREYAANTPWAGMPYGFPKLTSDEASIIINWLKEGAPAPKAGDVRYMQLPSRPKTIDEWENFFNTPGFNHRITARYIYEHLFLGHIYFDNMPGEFFRLIRAQCDNSICHELPTRRPTDDPATSEFFDKNKTGDFQYKFQKISSALVHKSHIPFRLNDEKLKKWDRLFIQQINKEAQGFPAYGDKAGANPFTTFNAIPAKSRYQFLLDDSYYFVNSFIKGPVCRGTGALSVIDDHFWVFFVNPESDITIKYPEFYTEAAKYLAVPAFNGDTLKSVQVFKQNRRESREIKKKYFNNHLQEGLSLKDIWNGDGYNSNAVLTVYRHEDSASVSRGALGESPKTMWLLDYPIFEDIYYNLVAMYDVYGSLKHQTATRLHMDASRFNAQDLFLGLIPAMTVEGTKYTLRELTRAQWTRDRSIDGEVPDCSILPPQLCAFAKGSAGTMREKVYPYAGPAATSQVKITDLKQPQKDIAQQILAKMPADVVKTTTDHLNKTPENLRTPIYSILLRKTNLQFEEINEIFGTFAGKKGLFASYLPELSYLQIIDDVSNVPEANRVHWYTMVHNREHYNVAFVDKISPETGRLQPEQDSLNIIDGFIGSYANAIFSVPLSRLSEFAKDILELRDKDSVKNLYLKFLVSRHNPNFWKYFDNMNYFAKQEGITPYSDRFEGATTDLNRYINDQGFE